MNKFIKWRRLVLALLLLSPLAFCLGNTIQEANPKTIYYFYIYLNDDKEVHFSLQDKPSVVYENDVFLVRTAHEAMQYPSSEVRRFMLQDKEENRWTGIKSVNQQNGRVDMSSPDEVTLNGLGLHSIVRVFTISGTLFQTYTANDDGTLRFSFYGWPRGTYVIKYGNKSFKIIRK